MQTLAGAEDALYQHWEVPGKPMAVYLSRAVSGRILLGAKRGLLPQRRPEVGGILLGKVAVNDTITVRIEDCIDLPCAHLFGPSYSLSDDEKQDLRHLVIEHGAGDENENSVVGFYRTHTRRGLALDTDDLQLADLFPEGADLALLIHPRVLRASRAALFFWDDAASAPDKPAVEFSIPRHGSRDFPGPVELLAAAPQPEPPAIPRKPFWSSWWLQGPLAALLMAAWYVAGFAAGQQIGRVVPQPAPAPRDPYALSLIVLKHKENLHVAWDRQAPPIAAAERGSLAISDGGQSRTLDLTRAQLQHGTVAYHEVSDRVQMRLEIFLPGRRSVSETWESELLRSEPRAPSGL